MMLNVDHPLPFLEMGSEIRCPVDFLLEGGDREDAARWGRDCVSLGVRTLCACGVAAFGVSTRCGCGVTALGVATR